MRRLLAAGALAAGMVLGLGPSAAAAPDVAPQRDWRQIQSAHFRVMGDVSPRVLRQVAGRMEQLHELLTAFTATTAAVEQSLDTTVLVFANPKAYRPFQPTYKGAPQDVAGYFLSGPMNYITLLMDRDDEGQSIVYHEYVHLVLNRRLGAVPPWIGEGLAEFYRTFEVTDGGKRARLGKMLQQHLWTLQQSMIPLETFAAVTHDSPYYNERDKNTVFYAQSWALVHYLQLGNQRKHAPKFAPFMDAVISGTPFATACQTVLGITPAALEKELQEYASAPVLFRVDVVLPSRLSTIEKLEPAPVPEAETHALLGDMLQRLDERPEGRAHLEHAVTLDARQSLALAALAQLDAEAGRLPQAKAFATAAAGPPSFLSEYYRAIALSKAATEAEPLTAPIETALRQATALNPSFAQGYIRLAEHLADAAATRPEALRLAVKAAQLAPVRDDYLLEVARIHLLNRDITLARTVLGPLAGRGSTAEVRTAARRYLAYSAELEAAMTRAAEPDIAPPPEAPEMRDAPAMPPNPADGVMTMSELVEHTAPVATPVLRTVGAGETRVQGFWTAIECQPAGVVVVAAASGTGAPSELRVRADALDRIEFTSYRTDTPSVIGCGPQKPLPVLITYRPKADGAIAGDVVAVEFLPDGYRPRGQ